jgi:hypothetical protein
MIQPRGMTSLETVLRRAGGIASTAALSAAGHRAPAVRSAVEAGTIRRIRRGFYAVPDAWPPGVAAVRAGGRLAGISAASSYGAWGGWRNTVHVVLASNASRTRVVPPPSQRREGQPLRDDLVGLPVELHWGDDPADRASCWRVSPLRSLRQVLLWSDEETAIACVETALECRMLGADDRGLLVSTGSERSARLIASCRRGSGSGIESIARQRLERLGFELRQQVPVEGVGRVDLQIVGTRVLIEIDGFAHHSDRSAFAAVAQSPRPETHVR